jgi:hypothetical protein
MESVLFNSVTFITMSQIHNCAREAMDINLTIRVIQTAVYFFGFSFYECL